MEPILLRLDTLINNYTSIDLMQGYNYILETHITDNYKDVDLTGITVQLQMQKPDKKFIIQTENIIIEGNKIKATLDKDFTRIDGQANLQVVLLKDNFTFGSWVVKAKIKPSAINDNDGQSENKVTITEALVNKINEAENVKIELDKSIANGDVATIKGNVDNIKDVEIPKINEQLETIVLEKTDRNEVFLKVDELDINDFNEETRKAIMENNSLDINYVLGEDNVTSENIKDNILITTKLNNDFFDIFTSYNRRITSWVLGNINSDTGEIFASSNRIVSDFITADKLLKIILYSENVKLNVFKYTSDKKYIGTLGAFTNIKGVYEFECPYIRVVMALNDNTTITNEIIKKVSKHIDLFENKEKREINIEGEKVNFNCQLGNINADTGEIFSSTNRLTSDFIDASKSLKIILNNKTDYSYAIHKYTSSGVYIVDTPTFNNEDVVFKGGKIRIVFKANANTTLTVSDMENVLVYIIDEDEDLNKSKLKGKTINCLGDSITGADYIKPTWWQMIASDNECTINDYGISGTTLTHTNERHLYDYHFTSLNANEIGYVKDDSSTWSTGNCFVERYVKMDDNADIITVMGGTNDAEEGVKLGTEDSKNTDTLYGALNVLCEGLLNKFPNKTIVFFTPMQRQDDYTKNVVDPIQLLRGKAENDKITSLQLISVVIKQVCNKYGLYVKDLYNESGINGVDTNKIFYKTNNSGVGKDNLHPSKEGQERLKIIIENTLLNLI